MSAIVTAKFWGRHSERATEYLTWRCDCREVKNLNSRSSAKSEHPVTVLVMLSHRIPTSAPHSHQKRPFQVDFENRARFLFMNGFPTPSSALPNPENK